MALTTEQYALINNLMYMDNGCGMNIPTMDQYQGMTIGDWITAVDTGAIDPSAQYDSFTTGQEWLDIIQAVRNDDAIMNMTINEVHVDRQSDGGMGRSAVLTDAQSGQAVVAFKGTQSDAEWKDNFYGGNVVDTPCQQNALEWYRQVYQEYGLDAYHVTVTGHSKGGNKAKYITVLDETVDDCVSFDGQGFSDKFIQQYEAEIARRQLMIHNHNVDYDYVNILLNDIGDTTYYHGYNLGEGDFLGNHCPNTFFQFHSDGTFQMNVNPNGQASEMQALDEFLNNYLRSMPDEDRTQALQLVATIWTGMPTSGDTADTIEFLLQLAADPMYSDDVAHLLAYAVEYEQANPELAQQIKNVLNQFGMGDVGQYVDLVHNVLNFEQDTWFGTVTFDSLFDVLDNAGGVLASRWLSVISQFLSEKCGIDLSEEQVYQLLYLVHMTNENMDTITIQNNGGDMQVAPIAPSENSVFAVNPSQLQQLSSDLEHLAAELSSVAEKVNPQATLQPMVFAASVLLQSKVLLRKQVIRGLSNDVQSLASSLSEIAHLYENTENTIVANAESNMG